MLFLVAAASAYLQTRKDNLDPKTTSDSGYVNLAPPTQEEEAAGDEQKQKNETEQTKDPQPSTSGQKQVKPIISSAGQFNSVQYGNAIEVRTLITGVYESQGNCTAIFKLGSSVIERSTEAIQDATTTRCDVVVIPRADFPSSGNWELVVKYTSPTSSGESDITRVEVK